MKKQLLINILFLAAYLLIVSFIKNWLDIAHVYFWIGGVLGTLLPDTDKLIYSYVLRTQGQTPQSVNPASDPSVNPLETQMVNEVGINPSRGFIFHSALFQSIFLIFAFFIVTSSGSLLGRGIVLGFMLHLVMSQTVTIMEKGDVGVWYRNFPITLSARQKTYYYWGNVVLLLLFGILL